MVIVGYRIKATNLFEIENFITSIRNKMETIVNAEYRNLVTEEAVFLLDQSSIGTINLDREISDIAVSNVKQRINRDEINAITSKYNLKCFCHILTDAKYTYLKLICPNKKLLEAFSELEDYSLSEVECEDKLSEKTTVWTELHKKYLQKEPVALNFTQGLIRDINFKDETLKYADVKERAETLARYTIQNQILSTFTHGEQIPPIRLMPYFDEVIETFSSSEEYQKRFKDDVSKLMKILIDVNKNPKVIYKRFEEGDLS